MSGLPPIPSYAGRGMPKITKKQALAIAESAGYRGSIPGNCSDDYWSFVMYFNPSNEDINRILAGGSSTKKKKSANKRTSTKKKA